MSSQDCTTCNGQDFIKLATYKRYWRICRQCGSGIPTQRKSYPYSFLPYDDLGKNSDSAEKMYDYFSTDVHLENAKQEAVEFYDRYLKDKSIDFGGKSVLDVSGGNGYFVRWFQENLGAKASLSEYNKKTIEFAQQEHDFENIFEYDMNNDNLLQKAGQSFDIVIAKACLMFCDDLANFVSQLEGVLAPGGTLILGHCVQPTLGTLVRVQLDEFSYSVLRQPGIIQTAFESGAFSMQARIDETDPGLYVYDHDLLPHWMVLHYFYEIMGARKLRQERLFNLPARDRRRSTFIFKKTS